MGKASRFERIPRPSSLGRLATVVLTAGFTLVLAEAVCRFIFHRRIESLKFDSSDLYYYHDREGFRHNTPNRVGYERMWNDQGKAEFRIDSLGFRGEEPATPKPAGLTRILFLGDSITLGGRLPEPDTFVARVRAALAKEKKKFEVLNAGVGDVGLIEEEQTLKGAGLAAKPDVLVLCWYLNDARPPVGFPEEVVYGNPLIVWFNAHPVLFKSYLAGFAYDALRRLLVAREMVRDRRFDYAKTYESNAWNRDPLIFAKLVREARFDWGDAWSDESLAWMAAKIASLRDFAKAHGIRLVVVALPVQAQVYVQFNSPLVDKPQRELAAALAKNNIPMLDLLPELRGRARTAREKIFFDQCHYTPYGNGLVAEAVLAFLKRDGGL